MIFFKGLNFGIDFKGGTLIELKKDNDLTIAEIRSQLSGLNIGDIQIQTFGSDNIILIRIEKQSNDEILVLLAIRFESKVKPSGSIFLEFSNNKSKSSCASSNSSFVSSICSVVSCV